MTIASMTAYGQGSQEHRGYTYTCEIRTLNSRYLEVSARLPRHLIALEVELTNIVKGALKRGKVDLFVAMGQKGGGAAALTPVNHAAVSHYLTQARVITDIARGLDAMPIPAPLTVMDLLQLPQVLSHEDQPAASELMDIHKEGITLALNQAWAAVKAARSTEGAALGKALSLLLDELERDRSAVASRRDKILQSLQATFMKRLETTLAQLSKNTASGQPAISEERALIEVAILSDKADIEEELTRLATHIQEMRRLITSDDGAGRKLDFLCQEMHREVNTMSSKLVQTEVSQFTLEMKQTVERIRQQVQNIE
jgi:uncharacterized protein (TIGR00255 family)